MEQSTKDDDILEMVVFRSENSKRVAGSPNQLGIKYRRLRLFPYPRLT
jgi:hypothetical protein